MSGYRECPDCGGELVEVDNPFRREVRHRRGAPPCSPLTPEQRAERDSRLLGLLRDHTPMDHDAVIAHDLRFGAVEGGDGG